LQRISTPLRRSQHFHFFLFLPSVYSDFFSFNRKKKEKKKKKKKRKEKEKKRKKKEKPFQPCGTLE
jgi:hypothetical protein